MNSRTTNRPPGFRTRRTPGARGRDRRGSGPRKPPWHPETRHPGKGNLRESPHTGITGDPESLGRPSNEHGPSEIRDAITLPRK